MLKVAGAFDEVTHKVREILGPRPLLIETTPILRSRGTSFKTLRANDCNRSAVPDDTASNEVTHSVAKVLRLGYYCLCLQFLHLQNVAEGELPVTVSAACSYSGL